jgi:hypothetical protein
MGKSTQDMRLVRRRSHDWRLVVVVATLVVAPTMVAMTAVAVVMFALLVSLMLARPIRTFTPPAPAEAPETSARPDGNQQQQDRESFHLKPYLSVCASSPRWLWFRRWQT